MTNPAPELTAARPLPLKPFQYVLLPTNDPQGKPVLAVVAKRTYRIRPGDECVPAEEQLPLFPADKFFEGGDPLTASCEYETDFYPFKARCDFVLNGHARASGGRAVRAMGVGVGVGRRSKIIQVFGDRFCRYNPAGAPSWTEPAPFVEMPLRYEKAYGGVDTRSREDSGPLVYARNPIGKGYVVLNKADAVHGLALPNLEDPAALLTPETLLTGEVTKWQAQPMPQSFGWYGKAWFPRCLYAGVMPEHLSLYEQTREVSMGYVPPEQLEDFKRMKMPLMDFRFFNGAPLDMQFDALSGGEPVRIAGMSQDNIEFPLPAKAPLIAIEIGQGPQTPSPVLHTVFVDVDALRLYLVWRAWIPYPGPERMHELPTLDITVTE